MHDYSLFDPLRRRDIKCEDVMEDPFSLLCELVALVPLFLDDPSALRDRRRKVVLPARGFKKKKVKIPWG